PSSLRDPRRFRSSRNSRRRAALRQWHAAKRQSLAQSIRASPNPPENVALVAAEPCESLPEQSTRFCSGRLLRGATTALPISFLAQPILAVRSSRNTQSLFLLN